MLLNALQRLKDSVLARGRLIINIKTIYKIIGSLLFIEAFLLLVCLGIAYLYGEDDKLAFTLSALACVLFGFVMRYLGRDSDNTLSRRDTYLVVSLTWIVFSLFGTLPFLIGGYLHSFTDAFFEAMSGFTTTGASIIDDVEALPHGILFWRSLMQWIGGLGIVFFTIALLPSLVGGSVKVFAAESSGPLRSRLHPRLSNSSKWIMGIYTGLTLLCFVCLWGAGLEVFNSVNYALCTLSTGGLTPLNSTSSLGPLVHYILIFFCFIAGVNFSLLYYSVFKLNFRRLFSNAEFQLYVAIMVVATLFIAIQLMARNGYPLESALRNSLFQVVSFTTTAGFSIDDAANWPYATWVVLAACMVMGGCAGSTSGGVKCLRGVVVLKSIRNELKHFLHPNAVLPVKIDGSDVPMNRRVAVFSFISLYLLIFFLSAFVMSAFGIDKMNTLTITLSCLSNAGATVGAEISNTMSWSILPLGVKWMCIALMLIGRLEIFSVLVIFTPAFWKDN